MRRRFGRLRTAWAGVCLCALAALPAHAQSANPLTTNPLAPENLNPLYLELETFTSGECELHRQLIIDDLTGKLAQHGYTVVQDPPPEEEHFTLKVRATADPIPDTPFWCYGALQYMVYQLQKDDIPASITSYFSDVYFVKLPALNIGLPASATEEFVSGLTAER